MGRLFGTDGIRGAANDVLRPELALQLGRALVTVLREEGIDRPTVLVGRDPRLSGPMLESALVAGIASAGGTAVTLGVLPTPGIAYLAASTDASAGVVISASHNPVGDNGIKVFGADGFKLSDDEEDRLEQLIRAGQDSGPRPLRTDIGRIFHDPTMASGYVEHLVSASSSDLTGLKIVIDGANGAASEIAPLVYRRLGADVVPLHCHPDGTNINAGVGSTYPEVVREATLEHGADVGLAHDGDADRLIAVAADGTEIDGDVTLAVLAIDRAERGDLTGGSVATTVMTNLGFKQAMARHDIRVVETKVGDRYVLEAMLEHDLVLGGEQSGHIIQLDAATTGDGLLTAVRLLDVVRRTGRPLSDLATVMTRLPQVLVNVAVADKDRLADAAAVWSAIEREETDLGGDGRVLVRPSGTEPVVRVMVEAPTADEARAAADRIAKAVEEELGSATR